MEAVVRRGEKQSRESLVEQLTNPTVSERQENLIESVLPLGSGMNDDPASSIRLAGLVGLGHLARPDDEIVRRLLQAVKSSEPYERQAAAHSLGQLGCNTKPVIEALQTLVAHDYDSDVLLTAVATLKRFGAVDDALVIAVLKKVDPQGYFFQAAVISLGELGMVTDAVVSTLCRPLRGSYITRWHAVESLGALQWRRGHNTRPVLIALNRLQYDSWPGLRRAVLEAIKEIVRGTAGL